MTGRAWGLIVDGIAALGTVMIVILMAIICADIVARNMMGSSLPLVSETGGMVVVLIVALQLAAAVRAGRLARTLVFLDFLTIVRPRLVPVLESLFALTGAAVIGGVAWATWGVLVKDWNSSEYIGTPGLGTLPTWPFRVLILLGFAVAAVEFLRLALASARSALGQRA
jgi:TRAP-type mannitol/chloroaromatic compound transport system permease small subunit